MHPSADDETLLISEDYARQYHALNQQPRSHSGRRTDDETRHAQSQTVRTILRLLSLVLAITILGIQAYSMYTWLKTRHRTARNSTTGLQTKVWAVIDTWPTRVMLGAALAAVFVHLIAFGSLCGCFQGARQGPSHKWAVYLSYSLMVAAWIGAVVYFKIVDSKGDKKKGWDLWSWSCHKRTTNDGGVAWNALCIENTYNLYSATAVAVLEALGLILFIASHRAANMTMPTMKMPKFSGYRRF